MQYLISTARNLSVVLNEQNNGRILEGSELNASVLIELILSSYGRQVEFVDGNLVSIKKTQSTRLGLSINAAESLVTHLQESIQEAKIIESRLKEGTMQCNLENE